MYTALEIVEAKTMDIWPDLHQT